MSSTASAATSPLTCIVVDDDASARATLEHFVSLTPTLNLVASFPDGLRALEYFRAGNEPDIMFLDVEMPHLSGLDLLRLLDEPPSVILITAHAEFAVDAFDLRVVDYLMKPFKFPRFMQAVKRLQKPVKVSALPAREPMGGPAAAKLPPSGLFVKVNNRLVQVLLDDIVYVEALSNYVVLVTTKGKQIVYTTMKDFHKRLPEGRFLRVNRSFIIHTRWIESLDNHDVHLVGGHTVAIGKSYRDAFLEKLNVS
ncbi:LytR/AlgR family response regulator transcription factor [Hymenobacter canadensis]|uniref:LytTR family DNA-binding domain-containing protein n=1 Tax=Hymenobacter canadensis TaxID=2999067 RepID=A0ABY7LVZ8_9BACT|nr:LytTR family DNA-binding domain-containing protein [Hymenobacter canadensis]WBA44112.1 LytTR family DNA-binding domain-containing protein [Hymenobacter canadensis]